MNGEERVPRFDPSTGLVAAVVQDWRTLRVLMVGYMNEEALAVTKGAGRVTFFSRSKGRLWTKGETSGNFLAVKEITVDCDGDALLVKAEPAGPTCHTGDDTCFREVNTGPGFLGELERIITARKDASAEGASYTSSLFAAGTAKMAQKVGEEAVEVVIEAMKDDRSAFLNEAADLMFHYLVLLAGKGVRLSDVGAVLESRHRSKS